MKPCQILHGKSLSMITILILLLQHKELCYFNVIPKILNVMWEIVGVPWYFSEVMLVIYCVLDFLNNVN